MSALFDFSELLQSINLKKTGNRLEILTLLEDEKEPLSAETIHEKLNKKGNRVPMSTIYRTLETLTDNNIVNRLRMERQSRCLYELNHKQHHHFLICLGCGKIVVVDGCPIPEGVEDDIESEYGFRILGHRLEFFGYCPDCQKKKLKSI